MPKLLKDFKAVMPGSVYPETFPAGSECPAELLRVAESLGLIEEKAISPAVENKVIAASPENKAIKSAPARKAKK